MPKNYESFDINGQKAFIKRSEIKRLKKADALIFDCDGVLIEVRESYNLTIMETIKDLTNQFLGFPVLNPRTIKEAIYFFRRSGGFNIDWDTVYATLMFVFCSLSPKNQKKILKSIKEG